MYKRCINGQVDGVSENKIYKINETNIKVGSDGVLRYWMLDDYGVYNGFRADRFIDVQEYNFQLWHCLNLNDLDVNEQATTIRESLDCVYDNVYTIDDEGVLKINITLFDIKEIMDISLALDDDIVMYGCDYEYLMTKKTMAELGLN